MMTEERIVELVAPEGFTRDGEQLELCMPVRMLPPWSGQSARGLTRVAETLRLGPTPAGGLRD